jgi:hypothetical protein
MQLKLAFLDPPNPPPAPCPAASSTTAWSRLDEASRVAALEILTRLIARMLATKLPSKATGASTKEASDE